MMTMDKGSRMIVVVLFSLPAAAPAAPLGGGVAGRGVDPLPLPRPGVWPEAGAGLHN